MAPFPAITRLSPQRIPRLRYSRCLVVRHFSLGDNDSNQSNQDFYEEALQQMESASLYGLGSKQSELHAFANKLERGSLNCAYVWESAKASRLIATVLCNRFIPPLVLHERKKGIFDVVDGKQRLTTLLGFYMNRKKRTVSRRSGGA